MNTSKHAILLMPPQVQLGGKSKAGKIVKHERWSTAEQLTIMDFRLSRRRVGTGERADGVVVFERPPYKQSNETLFLQMAESQARMHAVGGNAPIIIRSRFTEIADGYCRQRSQQRRLHNDGRCL